MPVAPIDKLTTSNIHYKTEKADHFNDFPRIKLTRHALFLLWKYYGIYPVGKNLCAKMYISMRKCAVSMSNCANMCQAVRKRAKVGIIRTFNEVWHSLSPFGMA